MNRDQIHILQDIFKMLTSSGSPEESLNKIVQLIAERFVLDACSIYVFDPSENKLKLKASVGLSKYSINSIVMDTSEGLTGMVIETMAPVFVLDPKSHPRFKYCEGSGEEKYQTFLGLPLIYHQKILGALVIQTIDEDGILEEDIPVFNNIAGQASATLAYTGLFEGKKSTKEKIEKFTKASSSVEEQENNDFLRGKAVSDHVGEGYVHYLLDNISFDQVMLSKNGNAKQEEERLINSFEEAIV